MKYIVVIWCNDCTNEDPDGCFEGLHAYLIKGFGGEIDDYTSRPKDAHLFDTQDEAEKAAEDFIGDVGPWEYEVQER